MSYDQERKAIFEELISATKQIDKEYPCVGAKGKDGIGVQLAREATERYNKALRALKKKYGK